MEAKASSMPAATERPAAGTRRRGIAARLLREPLVHFVVLGALLFGVWAWQQRQGPRTSQPRTITLTVDDIRQLQIGFAAQWRRPPTDPRCWP